MTPILEVLELKKKSNALIKKLKKKKSHLLIYLLIPRLFKKNQVNKTCIKKQVFLID